MHFFVFDEKVQVFYPYGKARSYDKIFLEGKTFKKFLGGKKMTEFNRLTQKEYRKTYAAAMLPHDEQGYAIISKRQTFERDDDGKIILHRIKPVYQEETDYKLRNSYENSLMLNLDLFESNGHKYTGGKGKDKRKKKNKKYKTKKLKKKLDNKNKKRLIQMKEEALEENEPNISSITSELLSVKEHICVYEGDIYLYNPKKGCFEIYNEQQIKLQLMKLLEKKERLRIWASDINNAYKLIPLNPDLQQDLSPRVNMPLVNCRNGILDVESMELLKHSPQYGFTSCIESNFNLDADGKVTRQFIQDLTQGDKELKTLLQEVLGYVFSSYVHAKKAFIFYGVAHSGKSVLLSVIERIVGSNNVSHVNLQNLSEPCYAARLNNSKLNIAPDLPQIPIKDIGTFKSLVSSLDKIESKELYKNPKSQRCYCRMLFGANQFVPLDKLDANNAEAFFERLIIIPFLYAKPETERDPNLVEKLWAERDYIFTWAMKGLKRLIQNNFIFTSSEASVKVLAQYKTQYCPEQVFFSQYLVLDKDGVISREKVQELYECFSDEHGQHTNRQAMKSFISNNYPQVKQKRKRINGSRNPLAVYVGLNFSK